MKGPEPLFHVFVVTWLKRRLFKKYFIRFAIIQGVNKKG